MEKVRVMETSAVNSNSVAPTQVAPTERVDLPLLGMHCASCASRVEKALSRAEGVESCSVNFATTRATVHYHADRTNLAALRDVVKKAGYDAIVAEEKPTPCRLEQAFAKRRGVLGQHT
jgi:Cu+-exporting ATPase